MAASPGRPLPTNSFRVIRTPIAVLSVAPFSPDRYYTRQSPAKPHWGSIVPRRGSGFDSLEPTSPEVGCTGKIKLKQKWVNASNSAEKKPGRTTAGNLLSKIKKFIFGSRRGGRGDCGAGSGDCPIDEGCRTPYPTLGQLKRYPSRSYDATFGDIYTRPLS